MLIHGYDSPKKLLIQEIRQREEEGFSVPERIRQAAESIPGQSEGEPEFQSIYSELEQLEKRTDFPFEEPDELTEIRALRPERKTRKIHSGRSDAEMLDKYHGAWIGRAVGCALGKPVEGMGMNGRKSRDIRAYLQKRGDWPLRNYFSGKDADDGIHLGCTKSLRENIQFMESDDDIRYTLIALMLFEQYGNTFTSEDIAALWNRELPMNLVCTAERQALLNYNLRSGYWNAKNFDKTFTRRYNNPYREWIGAQIRADFFGFAAAGDPERAAEYAWRDASWTHVKNGIYGEMFIAALQAAAFFEDDPRTLIETGLAEIPANCRLANAIREALQEIPKHQDMNSFNTYMEQRYSGMSSVHTINNAVVCCAALFYGNMDPDRCVCEAVTGGLDTDCNGATVGAIAGIVRGAKHFGGILAPRLNDTIRAEFSDFREIRMSELAERTLSIWKKYGKTEEGFRF